MDMTRLAAFTGVAFLVILFPGPSVLFIVSRSLSMGRRAALTTVVGNQLGELIQVGAVAVGVGSLVAASEIAFTVMKLLGAAYLIYLGVQTLRHRREASPGFGTASHGSRLGGGVLVHGMVVGLTNPKTMVFFVAVLPQFVDSRLGHVPLQLLALGGVWALIALLSDSAWALAASTARNRWLGAPRSLRRLRTASGTVLVGLGLGLVLSSRSAA